MLTVKANVIDVLELRDLEKALGRLATEQRQVILLSGMEGMSYEDIALILGVPIGTVRSRLSRGRDHLRRLMGIYDESSGQLEPTNSQATPRLKPTLHWHSA